MTEFALFAHQLEALERSRLQRRLALFWEPGLGKTIAAYAICNERRMLTLVLCPKAIMKGTWQDDAEYFPELEACIWHGSRIERAKMLDGIKASMHYGSDASDDVVLITTYETFRRYIGQLSSLGLKRLIVDESSKMKNRDSQTSKAIVKFASLMEEVYLLSGTPAPNGPEEYYAQIKAIYGPQTPPFYLWARKYLHEIRKTYFIPGGGGKKRTATDKYVLRMPEEFALRLDRMAITKQKVDCVDLPEKMENIVHVDLKPAERKLYNNLLDGLVTEIDGKMVQTHAAAVAMKLRQVTGGNFKDGDAWRKVGGSKLEALADVIESLANQPFLIWTQFHSEADRVSALLEKMEIGHRVCDGRSEDVQCFLQEFKDGVVQSLVCHPQTVGHGCTLVRCGEQYCTHSIYYAMSYSYEQHAQSMDRIHRVGQIEPCTYWYLIARDSIDETMVMAVRQKAKVATAVLDSLRDIAKKRAERDPA